MSSSSDKANTVADANDAGDDDLKKKGKPVTPQLSPPFESCDRCGVRFCSETCRQSCMETHERVCQPFVDVRKIGRQSSRGFFDKISLSRKKSTLSSLLGNVPSHNRLLAALALCDVDADDAQAAYVVATRLLSLPHLLRSALKYAQRARALYAAKSNWQFVANLDFRMGDALETSSPQTAMKHYESVLALEKSASKIDVANAHLGLGNVLGEFKDMASCELALHHYKLGSKCDLVWLFVLLSKTQSDSH